MHEAPPLMEVAWTMHLPPPCLADLRPPAAPLSAETPGFRLAQQGRCRCAGVFPAQPLAEILHRFPSLLGCHFDGRLPGPTATNPIHPRPEPLLAGDFG